MIKYYVEEYNEYYPGGGLNDIVGPFDTFQEALDEYIKEYYHHDYTNIIRIVDSVIDREWTWTPATLP